MSFLQSILFGFLFGVVFQLLKITKEHKKRIQSMEDFLLGYEECVENEVDD